MYRAVVVKVVYTDDSANITANGQNPRVLYDCVVLGGFAAGQKISNCRLSSDLGGNNSYWERTLAACTKDVSGTRLSDLDGDVVLIQFNQGHTGSPYIVALDNGIKTVGTIGAAKADSPRSLRSFNGVTEKINKDGELQIDVAGGTADAEHGAFKPNDSALVSTVTAKDESVTRTFKSGLVIKEDGKNDKITKTFSSGLSMVEDGKGDKITLTTAGGVTVEIDGKGGKVTISKGSTKIVLDGNADKISLLGGFVDLGSSVSDFAVLFTELLTAFNTHTHISALPGTPTSPPIAPMLQTVGSLTVKVQP